MAQILDKQKQYSKYYGDFLGVDFSDAQTQVNDRRLAYLCNMWKDYHNGQGKGIETIPGFREVMRLAGSGKINGIHEYVYREEGVERRDVIVHRGTNLYIWHDFPATVNTEEIRDYTLGAPVVVGGVKTFHFEIDDCYECIAITCQYEVTTETGVEQRWAVYNKPWIDESRVKISGKWRTSFDLAASQLFEGNVVKCTIRRYPTTNLSNMANHKSVSFVFNNNLYILDGTNYLVYDGETIGNVEENAYIPTIYINGIPDGANKTLGTEYKQRNMLTPYFKQTYIADGETKEYQLAVANLDDISSIKVYGEEYLDLDHLGTPSQTTNIIRSSFRNFSSGPIDGKFKLVKTNDNGTDKWVPYMWVEDSEEWIINDGYGQPRSYTAAQIGLSNIGATVTANPSFVKVDAEAWENSQLVEFYELKANGDTVFQYMGTNEWHRFQYPDDTTWNLKDAGVEYSENLGWFSTSDADPEHNLLTITRYAIEEIIFTATSNGSFGNPTYQEIPNGDKVTFNLDKGIVTFTVAPLAPENKEQEAILNDPTKRYYPEGYAGIEITAAKAITSIAGLVDETIEPGNIIKRCTMAAAYDGRIFLSGNPRYPNTVFWCGRNVDTGFNDPSYWGVLDYVNDGVESVPVTAMIPIADTLAVLKGNTKQDGSVFYHSPLVTDQDVVPVTYPSKQGLAGTGCLGAAINFRDDPVFVSEDGLNAIGQLSVRLERALEHRSTLVDTKLTNEDLARASLNVWDGYLVLSVDGKFYIADSRQPYTNAQGIMEYEWYYLEDIGDYDGQYEEYRFMDRLQYNEHLEQAEDKTVEWCSTCHKDKTKCECSTPSLVEIELRDATAVYDPAMYRYQDLSGTTVNPPKEDGTESTDIAYITETQTSVYDVFGIPHIKTIYYAVKEVMNPTFSDEETQTLKGYEAYLVEKTGAMIGGTFYPASVVASIDGILTFGTDNGKVFVFNTDKRNDDGSIDAEWYSFNGRAIACGCATKLDNCDVPHLTKTTIRKSIVIKTRNYDASAAKIKVRTNNDVFNQIARINNMRLDFSKLDFRDFSFSSSDKDLFAIKEKEKKWVEKQYFIYSDEIKKPFALYYLAYRYYIHGRYKNR